jgi:hypothetical protein
MKNGHSRAQRGSGPMSELGQSRRLERVSDPSACPLTPDVSLRRSEPMLRATRLADIRRSPLRTDTRGSEMLCARGLSRPGFQLLKIKSYSILIPAALIIVAHFSV